MRSAKKATVLENFRRAEAVQHPPLGGYIKRKSVKSYDSTLFFGALAGTRIPGPLIKSANQALLVHVAACNPMPVFAEIPRIFQNSCCTDQQILHLLSTLVQVETVQIPCKNRAGRF